MHVYYSPTVYSGYYESLWRSYYLVFRGSKIFLVAVRDSETFTRECFLDSSGCAWASGKSRNTEIHLKPRIFLDWF